MAHSAGLLIYRKRRGAVEVFLVHPGGPFWKNKDDGAWSIPKGEFVPGEEEALDAALREFGEETGLSVSGDFRPLRPLRQAGGKTVHAWAVEAEVDAEAIRCGTFSMEWPPRSGRSAEFPEVDRAAWFGLAQAGAKLLKSQGPLLDQLAAMVD